MTQIVTTARTWIGTPYVHRGARRGAGCDCLGLLRGVWAEAGNMRLQSVPAYTPDWSEPQGDEVLWSAATEQLNSKPIEDARAGDVLLFRMRQGAVAKHIGLQADTGQQSTFIHSYQGHGVCENAFSAPWQRRLVARFSIPGFF